MGPKPETFQTDKNQMWLKAPGFIVDLLNDHKREKLLQVWVYIYEGRTSDGFDHKSKNRRLNVQSWVVYEYHIIFYHLYNSGLESFSHLRVAYFPTFTTWVETSEEKTRTGEFRKSSRDHGTLNLYTYVN